MEGKVFQKTANRFIGPTPTLLFLGLLLAALLWLWGAHPAEQAYGLLQTASAFVEGNGRLQLALTPLESPLYTLLLTVLSFVGLPLISASIWLSGLAWLGLIAILLHWQPIRHSFIGLWLAVGLLVAPPFWFALGSHAPWLVALGWLAIWLEEREQWGVQAIVLFLLPLFDLSLPTAGFALLLLFRRQQKMTAPFLLLAILLFGWSITIWELGWLQTWWQQPFVWATWGKLWWQQNNLVLLLLPLALLGGWQWRRHPLLIWLLLTVTDHGLVGSLVLAVGLLVLSALGILWLWQMWEVGQIVYAGLVILLIPLLLLTWQAYRLRPLTLAQTESVAGRWLAEQADGQEMVFGLGRVAVASRLPGGVWNGRLANEETIAQLVYQLSKQPPDFIVSNQALGWQALKSVGWFQQNYQPLRQFAVPTDTIAPLTVWEYTPAPVLQTAVVPLDVRLENGAQLTGYQYWPQQIAPGEAVQVALHWQASPPLKRVYNSLVWVSAPLDGAPFAQADWTMPRSVPAAWWQPGQTVVEQVVITTTETIDVGGYLVNIAFREQEDVSWIPLYRNQDSNALDRIVLGYVAVPDRAAVAKGRSLGATFGETIRLLSAELPEDRLFKGGETAVFTLYWEADALPAADYTVFIHLFDETGGFVTSADGPTRGGTYPTGAWRSGTIVVDERQLVVPPDLAPGVYQVRVGFYLPETGERLASLSASGESQADNAFPLWTLEVE